MSRAAPGAMTRLGLAIAAPRWGLAVADEAGQAGRAGNDFIRALGILLLAAHTRRLVAAVWLAVAVGLVEGARGVVAALSQTLTLDLAFLVIATLAVWLAAGPRRALGRAFDLVCVAAIPLVVVELVATAVVRGLEVPVPAMLSHALTGVAFGWSGALVALAWRRARRPAPSTFVELPPEIRTRGQRAGAGFLAVAVAALAINTAWIVRNAELLEPMTPGDPAPAFALPEVAAGGARGTRRGLEAHRGKIVVLDFWATWCGPCVDSLPVLGRIAGRLGGDGAVVLVNLDDASAARQLVDRHVPGATLLFDDQHVAERYGVSALPHTVVIDRTGRVREVLRGGGDAAAAVARVAGW